MIKSIQSLIPKVLPIRNHLSSRSGYVIPIVKRVTVRARVRRWLQRCLCSASWGGTGVVVSQSTDGIYERRLSAASVSANGNVSSTFPVTEP